MPKHNENKNKKKLSSQNENYFFGHQMLIFHYGHKCMFFQLGMSFSEKWTFINVQKRFS